MFCDKWALIICSVNFIINFKAVGLPYIVWMLFHVFFTLPRTTLRNKVLNKGARKDVWPVIQNLFFTLTEQCKMQQKRVTSYISDFPWQRDKRMLFCTFCFCFWDLSKYSSSPVAVRSAVAHIPVEGSSHTLRQSGAGRAARGEAGLQVCLWPENQRHSHGGITKILNVFQHLFTPGQLVELSCCWLMRWTTYKNSVSIMHGFQLAIYRCIVSPHHFSRGSWWDLSLSHGADGQTSG